MTYGVWISALLTWINSLSGFGLRSGCHRRRKTIALNAADEVAVAAFLDEQIDFQTFRAS